MTRARPHAHLYDRMSRRRASSPSLCLQDVGEHVLMPGVVDVAHRLGLDVPPSDYRHEGAAQGSRAAAGGVTTILDLPARGAPGGESVASLRARFAALKSVCHVDVAPAPLPPPEPLPEGAAAWYDQRLRELLREGARALVLRLTPRWLGAGAGLGHDRGASIRKKRARLIFSLTATVLAPLSALRARARRRAPALHRDHAAHGRARARRARRAAAARASRPGRRRVATPTSSRPRRRSDCSSPKSGCARPRRSRLGSDTTARRRPRAVRRPRARVRSFERAPDGDARRRSRALAPSETGEFARLISSSPISAAAAAWRALQVELTLLQAELDSYAHAGVQTAAPAEPPGANGRGRRTALELGKLIELDDETAETVSLGSGGPSPHAGPLARAASTR